MADINGLEGLIIVLYYLHPSKLFAVDKCLKVVILDFCGNNTSVTNTQNGRKKRIWG